MPVIFRGKDVPMAEQSYTAADFEACAARFNGGGVWDVGDDSTVSAALRIASRVMRPGVIEGHVIGRDRRKIGARIRAALTETTDD